MHIIEKNIKKAEICFEKEKTGENGLALFACYILAAETIDSNGVYFSKAYHTAVTAHHEDMLDIDIISALLYSHILLGNYETAGELVKALDTHNAFLSKNMPLNYGQILYFHSIIQFKAEKVRSAKKIYRSLEILYEKTELAPLAGYLASLQKIVFENTALCVKMYTEAISKGCAGVYLYLEIYRLLMSESEYTKELNELSRVIIPWALNKDIPIGPIIERLEKRTLISILFSLGIGHLSKIYFTYKLSSAFQCLCQKLISSGDTSEFAFSCYKTALDNELNLRGLNQISVKAAYINNYYKLPISVVKSAITESAAYAPGQLAYLFSILISQDEGKGDIDEHIVKFGLWACSKGYRGKNFSTIYKFLHRLYPDDERFLDAISTELFIYDIRFSCKPPSYVCVYEYYKNGVTKYEVSGGVCQISAIGAFELYFLGKNENEYLSMTDYKVTKALNGENKELMEELYEKGRETPELIPALSMRYLAGAKLDKRKLDILQRATGLTEISKGFRLDICAALAAHYAEEKQYSMAIHYYMHLGEDNVKEGCLIGALNTYIATGRYESALSLISRKHGEIPDRTVYDALNVLYEKADSLEIATVCYDLIMKDLCSMEILNILLRKYKGPMEEWLKITNKIDSLGFDVSQLYEKIIVNGIFIGQINDFSNDAFIKLFQKNRDLPILLKYVYFCCYEVIRNDKHVCEDFAEVLEDVYNTKYSERLLCIALALIYINNGRRDKTRIISEAAGYLEEEGIILNKFKECQNNSFISSYIEKNTPFTYYQIPHKTIYICYKTEEQTSFTKKPLKYFKFGIYLVNITLFYDEKVTYYFEEENGVRTELQTYVNNHMRIVEQFNDMYYTINNLIIYEHMMKFDLAEKFMEAEISKNDQVSAIIL